MKPPIFGWVAGYPPAALRGDLLAGLTVAILLVPQALAYASLAGMPPEAGLYAALAALVAYAALGSSPQLAVGPVAMTALLTIGALAPFAPPRSAEYIALAGVLAVLVGTTQVAMRLLRLAALVNFLSRSVLSGFTAAAALIIASTQLKDLLGVVPQPVTGQSLLDVIGVLPPVLDQVNPASILIGVASVVALVIGRRVAPAFPTPLVLMVCATIPTAVFQLDTRLGVAVLGEVPSGLPRPGLDVPPTTTVVAMLPIALAIATVAFLEAITNAKAIALRTRHPVDAGRELVATGAMNVLSGVLSGFPVGGSFSRTALSMQTGAQTQLAGLASAAVVVVALLFLTPLLYSLPRAVLAAIVLTAVAGLIDLKTMRETWHIRHTDGLAVIFTFVATLVLGVGPGIGFGVAFSLLAFIYRSARPQIVELGRVAGTTLFRDLARSPDGRTDPSVVILRMDAPLYFANARFLAGRVEQMVAARSGVRHVVLNASTLTDVDADGARTLYELYDELNGAGVALHLVTLRGYVRDVIGRAGLMQRLLDDRRYWSDLPEAVASLDLPPDSPLRSGVADELRPDRVF